MRLLLRICLYALALAAGCFIAIAQTPSDAPLPDPYKLMQSALAN